MSKETRQPEHITSEHALDIAVALAVTRELGKRSKRLAFVVAKSPLWETWKDETLEVLVAIEALEDEGMDFS